MRTMDKVTCKESCSVWANTVLCVQNMFGYRLESNYRDGGISCVSSVTPDKFRLKLGHGRFHPHPFQFIIF